MKIMEKAKRFFTLNAAKHEGFTLVELIVVIAILAILAGVAVPAYSGYIEKSKRAGDETLLAAVNTAFAAACLQNGIDSTSLSTNQVKIILEGPVGAKTVGSVSRYNDEFFVYYEGNQNATFKSMGALYFVDGVFTDDASVYSNLVNNLADSDKNDFNNSVFADLGADALLEKVGQLTGFGSALIGSEGSTFYELVYGDGSGDTAYMETLATKMGYTWPNDKDKFMYDIGVMAGGETDEEIMNNVNSIFANGAVLSAASKTEGLDTSFLTDGNLKSTIQGNLNNADTAETGLAQSAMAYAMYMSYANSEEGKKAGVTVPELTGTESITDLTNMLSDMNSEGFQTYIGSEQGKADLAGYQASMNMINSSATDKDALNSILVNGFDDPNLAGILNSVITTK